MKYTRTVQIEYRKEYDKIRATRRKLPIKAEKALNRLRSRA